MSTGLFHTDLQVTQKIFSPVWSQFTTGKGNIFELHYWSQTMTHEKLWSYPVFRHFRLYLIVKDVCHHRTFSELGDWVMCHNSFQCNILEYHKVAVCKKRNRKFVFLLFHWLYVFAMLQVQGRAWEPYPVYIWGNTEGSLSILQTQTNKEAILPNGKLWLYSQDGVWCRRWFLALNSLKMISWPSQLFQSNIPMALTFIPVKYYPEEFVSITLYYKKCREYRTKQFETFGITISV